MGVLHSGQSNSLKILELSPISGLRGNWATFLQNQTFTVQEKCGSGHKEKLRELSSNSDFAIAILFCVCPEPARELTA